MRLLNESGATVNLGFCAWPGSTTSSALRRTTPTAGTVKNSFPEAIEPTSPRGPSSVVQLPYVDV